MPGIAVDPSGRKRVRLEDMTARAADDERGFPGEPPSGRWPSTGAEASPDGMQRLFTTAGWDQDAVREDIRGHVVSRSATRTTS